MVVRLFGDFAPAIAAAVVAPTLDDAEALFLLSLMGVRGGMLLFVVVCCSQQPVVLYVCLLLLLLLHSTARTYPMQNPIGGHLLE